MALTDNDADDNTGGGGGTPAKKKSPPAKYKQMVKRPDSDYMIDSHTDGSAGPGSGYVSDKAAGLSNTFYPSRNVQKGPAIPTQKRSSY